MSTDLRRAARARPERAPSRRPRAQVDGSRRPPYFLVAADLATLLVAMPLGIWLAGLLFGSAGLPSLGDRLWVLALPPLALPFLAVFRLYERDRRRVTVSSLGELFPTFNALSSYGFILLLILAGADALPDRLASREIFLFWVLGLVGIPLARTVVRRHAIPRATTPQPTLIVGAGHVGQTVARKIVERPDFNLEVVGFLDNEPQPLKGKLEGLKVLGGEEDLVPVIRESGAERVIICFSRLSHEELLDILRHSGLDRIYVSIVPRFFEILSSNVEIDDVGGIPLLDLHPARLSRSARMTKRVMDLVLTSLALPLLLPLFGLIAVAIKADSRGPVFFRQARMGRGGRTFRIFKFRTMIPEAESRRADLLHMNEVTGPLFKLKHDPRVTRVGRILRRTSLDELPQVLNVLSGDMSLVGPRPFVVYEAAEIRGWARRRVDLTPGITGAWQVMGRNDMPFEEMVKLDYLYVTNWSLGWDLKILLQTVPVVFRRRGAY